MNDIRSELSAKGYSMEVLSFNGEWMVQLYTKENKKIKVTSLIEKYDSEVLEQEVEEIE